MLSIRLYKILEKRCTANKFLPDTKFTILNVGGKLADPHSIFRFPLRHPIGVGDRVNTKENVLCEERKERREKKAALACKYKYDLKFRCSGRDAFARSTSDDFFSRESGL